MGCLLAFIGFSLGVTGLVVIVGSFQMWSMFAGNAWPVILTFQAFAIIMGVAMVVASVYLFRASWRAVGPTRTPRWTANCPSHYSESWYNGTSHRRPCSSCGEM